MDRDEKNLAIQTYGHRIFESQTLPEYLLEFALVFLAEKPKDKPELGRAGEFPTREVGDKELKYVTNGRVGLKRFIFFERSKQENRLEIDRLAYKTTRSLLEEKIECRRPDLSSSDVIDIIQELFYGYNAVLLNRSWFVQSLLPVAPELVFPEAMRGGVKAGAASTHQDPGIEIQGNDDVDNDFEFNGYYFLARGGEVYFLHILQGLTRRPELRKPIEDGFNKLFNSRTELSGLARWIQETWEEYMQTGNKKIQKSCRRIPAAYAERAPYTCQELVNFLRAHTDSLRKTQLLSIGVVLQILRMMHDRAGALVGRTATRPAWILNVPGCNSSDVKGLAARSYQQCEDDLLGALYTQKGNASPDEVREMISKGARNAHLLFRKLAKAAELVVPPKGPNMRFSLSEDLLKFFVMSLIEPGEMVLLSDFLESLYRHFGIIIGPKQLQTYQEKNQVVRGEQGSRHLLIDDMTVLRDNEDAFKDMLKACGFLRDLSDATAIVENPFGGGEH